MRADAIPVVPLASSATLAPADVGRLFGQGHALRGTERVALTRLGQDLGPLPVRAGKETALSLEASAFNGLPGADGLRLRGPLGTLAAPVPGALASRLVLPEGLRLAWRVGAEATLGLGPLALAVPVAPGPQAAFEAERTLWLAAGCPARARWLAGLALPPAPAEAPPPEGGPLTVGRRVVTENDVRQARLHGRRIRLTPGQVVTPAAASMAREWAVFEAG